MPPSTVPRAQRPEATQYSTAGAATGGHPVQCRERSDRRPPSTVPRAQRPEATQYSTASAATGGHPVQYRERSDRRPHTRLDAVILTVALSSVASGRFARGTV